MLPGFSFFDSDYWLVSMYIHPSHLIRKSSAVGQIKYKRVINLAKQSSRHRRHVVDVILQLTGLNILDIEQTL